MSEAEAKAEEVKKCEREKCRTTKEKRAADDDGDEQRQNASK